MNGMNAPQMTADELAELDATVEQAIRSGDEAGLELLGYGEISCVIAWQAGDLPIACKRLPSFGERTTLDRYERCFSAYLEVLRARGVTPVGSALATIHHADGSSTAYCVQPRLAGEALLNRVLHTCRPAEVGPLFERLLAAILGAVDRLVGLDGQLSNWALCDGELLYLDVTTPMLRSPEGDEESPNELFLASLPWALRGLVRRWMLRGILDTYYGPRGVILDLLGNLYKERLSGLLPQLVDQANAHLEVPIQRDEIDRYYARDARDWALLQRLRRIDRAWQRKIRRRPYPFIIPGAIER